MSDLLARLPLWKRAVARLSRRSLPHDAPAAIRELEQMAAATPDFAPIHYVLKQLYTAQGRSDEARRAGERMREAIRAVSTDR
jgi:hypothetical protein